MLTPGHEQKREAALKLRRLLRSERYLRPKPEDKAEQAQWLREQEEIAREIASLKLQAETAEEATLGVRATWRRKVQAEVERLERKGP